MQNPLTRGEAILGRNNSPTKIPKKKGLIKKRRLSKKITRMRARGGKGSKESNTITVE